MSDITFHEEKKKRRRKRRINEITPENDIRFRGPLSYRHLRILGWLAIAVLVACFFINLAVRYNPALQGHYGRTLMVLDTISSLAVPLFLLANFAVILNAQGGYKRLIIQYGAIVAVIFVAFLLIYFRYYMGLMEVWVGDEAEIQAVSAEMTKSNVLACNLFLDLLLCTLLMYFLNGRPKRFFAGKKMIIFRLFALLPIIYEAVCIAVKLMSAQGKLEIPVWCYPLLTTKPPVTFLVFVVLALFLKLRERKFLRYGGTYEEYQAFLKTNVNSLQFSGFTAIVMVIAAILDFVILIVLLIGLNYDVIISEAANTNAVLEASLLAINGKTGFGDAVGLIMLAPILPFFSYTKTHKNGLVDLAIPALGVVLTVLVGLECSYQVARMGPEILMSLPVF